MLHVNRRSTSNAALIEANHGLSEQEMLADTVGMSSYPERLSLYWRSKCSLDCAMCAKHALDYPLDREEDLVRVVERVDGLFPHVSGFCLCPSGEPLESKVLFDLAGHAYADTRIVIVTNGQLLRGQILDHVFEYRIDHLSISLNAAKPETYERITGARFEALLGNISTLLRCRDGGDGRPHLDFSIIAMKQTEAELKDFIRLAADLGGERAIVRKLGMGAPAAACRRGICFDPKGENILDQGQRDEALLAELQAVGADAGIRVSADFGQRFTRPPYTYGLRVQKKVDPRPWKTVEFLPTGDSRFACGHPADLGNIWQYETFHEFWNNGNWTRARQRTLD